MVECSLGDLVCLHLAANDGTGEAASAPRALTAAGIGDALEVGDDAVARIQLLSRLDALVEKGLVTAGERAVAARAEPRTVYRLTGPGRDHAAAVRERLAAESVVLADGSTQEVPLSEVSEYVDADTDPMVTAVARLTADGEVSLEGPAEERFVGRRAELDALVDTVEGSFERGSRTAVVAGDAGIGKTALVREAVEDVRDRREDVVLARGASQEGAVDPYAPLRQAFDALPDGGELTGRLAEAGATVTPEDPERVAAKRTALFDDVADALREVAGERPVVLFVDNLQWADEATLSLFGHLATAITEWLYPVAFVGSYRPAAVAGEDDHPLPALLDRLEAETNHTRLTLDPLARGETRALLSRILGRGELPGDFVEVVHDRTGGVPLFVTETVAHLVDEGVVDPSSGRYPATTEGFDLPGSVIEQVDRRLSALDGDSRELLRLGAVVGEYVPAAVLGAASDLDPARRREYVDLLVASRVWERVEPVAPGGSADLRFVSGLLREAVVERLPEGTARRYNERVADAMIALYDDDALGERAARVAAHLEAAGRPGEAAAFYRRAGDHARERYAHGDAVENYRRALAVVGTHDAADGPHPAALARELAAVHATAGDFAAAVDAVGEGLDHAPAASRVRAELLGVRARVETKRGDFDAAEETARRVGEMAAAVDATDLQAEALRRLGRTAQRQGDADLAEERSRRALDLAREADERDEVASILNGLGAALTQQGAFEEARDRFTESLEIERDLGDRHGAAHSLGNLGAVAMRAGDDDEARGYHEESLAAFREVGDRHGAARTLGNLGGMAMRAGDLDVARERYEESLAAFREVGDRHGAASVLGNLGVVAQKQAQFGDAADYYRESLETKRAVGDRDGAARTLNNLGLTAAIQGSLEEARRKHTESLRTFRDLGNRRGEGQSLKNLGRVAIMRGSLGRARQRLEDALALFRDIDDTKSESQALKNLAWLGIEDGDLQAAGDHLAESLAGFREVGSQAGEAKVRRLQGTLALVRGDAGTAREHLQEGNDVAVDVDNRHLVATTAGLLGAVATLEGDAAAARSALEDARSTLQSVGATPADLRLLRRHLEAAIAAGEGALASDLCGMAHERLAGVDDGGLEARRLRERCADVES
jgi:tetratricopeptide (TPR) repeat protein